MDNYHLTMIEALTSGLEVSEVRLLCKITSVLTFFSFLIPSMFALESLDLMNHTNSLSMNLFVESLN